MLEHACTQLLNRTTKPILSMNTTQIEKFDGRKSPMFAFLQKQGVDFSQKEHVAYVLKSEGFMPLTVETWMEGDFLKVSVCHYGEQNGDAMRDPEMVFLLAYGNEYPVYFRNDYVGVENTYAKIEDGKLFLNKRGIADLKSFSKTWASNLKAQGHKMDLTNHNEVMN